MRTFCITQGQKYRSPIKSLLTVFLVEILGERMLGKDDVAIMYVLDWQCGFLCNLDPNVSGLSLGHEWPNFRAKQAQLQKLVIHSEQLPVICPKNNTAYSSSSAIIFDPIKSHPPYVKESLLK